MSNHNKSGFTLIELIVVIVVLGTMVTITLFSYTKIQSRTRDQARTADMVVIANALERYYETNGEYPLGAQINPTNISTQLSSYTTVRSLLTKVGDNDLNDPVSTFSFFPYCSHPTSCTNVVADWATYHAKQYLYMTVYSGVANPQTISISDATYGTTAWGCSISLTTLDPGFALAYRREEDGVWVYYKSNRGTVTITDLVVDSKSCTFSKL